MPSRPVAFEGSFDIEDPSDDEMVLTGLARAIAEAARAAAKLGDLPRDEDTYFDVSKIQVGVRGNPGPTSYRVIITPGG
jgi:hypothetical protein